jgi:Leucine-rich repeat (LRR) protein
MQNITSSLALKNAIQLLEVEQSIKAQELRDQFYITLDSLKPVTIIRNALHDISASPHLVENILGTAMGIASGFLTNTIFVGASGNLVRKLLGSVLQFGVTNVVAQHPDTIKSYGQMILQFFLRKRAKNLNKL